MPVADMACLFLKKPIDVKVETHHRNLHIEKMIRLWMDALLFHDEYLVLPIFGNENKEQGTQDRGCNINA